MEIIILGSICARCQKTFDKVSQVVTESGRDATLRFETDVVKIFDYNILSLPAIVVDGVVKMNGKVPTESEVRKMLNLSKKE